MPLRLGDFGWQSRQDGMPRRSLGTSVDVTPLDTRCRNRV